MPPIQGIAVRRERAYEDVMRPRGRLAPLVAAALLAAGCGLFEGHKARGDGGGRRGDERCDVDLDQWKARVRQFKNREHRNKEDFRQAKDDLAHDLDRLDTAACRRELRNEISDLLDQVRSERF